MKNITKILFTILTAGSLMFTSANAGTLEVTGTAKATYNIIGGDHVSSAINTSKGLGVANEFNLGASGELDNGMSWNYKVSFDPDNTSGGTVGEAQNDDSSLTLTTDYGTVGVFIKTGGLDLDNAGSQSVYGRPTDTGYNEGFVDSYGIDAYSSLQWHSPADLLPYSTTIKLGYAPSRSGKQGSSNHSTAINDNSADGSQTAVQIKMIPVTGLNIGGSMNAIDDAAAGEAAGQEARSYDLYSTYKVGNVSVGASGVYREEAMPEQTGATEDIEGYKNYKVSAAFNVNDNLSVSYERERSNKMMKLGNDTFDIESHGLQAAYTMGGMTLAVSRIEHDNAAYTENKDVHSTIFAATMAF
mgnify:CR=1 FL=1